MKEECFICEGFTKTNESWLFKSEIIEIYNKYEQKVDDEFGHNPTNQPIKTYESDFIPQNTTDMGSIMFHLYVKNTSNPICMMCYSCIDIGIQKKFFGSSYSVGGIFSQKNVLKIDFNKIETNKSKWKKAALKVYKEKIEANEKEEKGRKTKENSIKTSIVNLLTKKSIKMTISDITAHIKHKDRNYVKRLLEEMHKDGDIDFAGSGRYFIYSEKKKEPKKATPKTKEVDVKAELKKYKGMLDDDLITQEQYDTKSNELLGL